MSSDPKERPAAPPSGPESKEGESPFAPDAKESGPKARKSKGRFRRRLAWTGFGILVVCLVARIALWLTLPWILEKTAASYELSCTYERLDLSILTGDMELWHLVLAPIEGGESLVDAEYTRADVAVAALFAGRLVVRRLEVDGMDIVVDRAADGTIPVLERIRNAAGSTAETENTDDTDSSQEGDGPWEIDLTPPMELTALRLQHVHTRFRDASVTPRIERRFDMNLRVSDLGSETRKARFRMTISSPPILDQLSVEGTGSSFGKKLEAELRVRVNGFHPRDTSSYLEPLGIRPAAREIAFALNARVEIEGIPKARAQGDAAAVEEEKEQEEEWEPGALKVTMLLEDMRFSVDGDESLALDRLSVESQAVGLLSAADKSGLTVVGHQRAGGAPKSFDRVVGPVYFGEGQEKSPGGRACKARLRTHQTAAFERTDDFRPRDADETDGAADPGRDVKTIVDGGSVDVRLAAITDAKRGAVNLERRRAEA